ncbi:MAG TPA: TauD/TfdA family dioxygenase [Thermoanaerobaculia bacterium]
MRANASADETTETVHVDGPNPALDADGYYVGHIAPPGATVDDFVLHFALSLGELYVPPDCDPAAPMIRTAPTRKRHAAPFDRPESIGWHGDFATHEDRPELSIVYITRPDPRGGNFGAWRLASVADVIATLHESADGRAVFDFLSSTPLPFSYTDNEAPRHFVVFEPRPHGRTGMRFYLPSIRRGCIAIHGEIPPRIASALARVEAAADRAARIVPTREGSLLVTSNWFALHDRAQQSVSRTKAKREALLCFVKRMHPRRSQP